MASTGLDTWPLLAGATCWIVAHGQFQISKCSSTALLSFTELVSFLIRSRHGSFSDAHFSAAAAAAADSASASPASGSSSSGRNHFPGDALSVISVRKCFYLEART